MNLAQHTVNPQFAIQSPSFQSYVMITALSLLVGQGMDETGDVSKTSSQRVKIVDAEVRQIDSTASNAEISIMPSEQSMEETLEVMQDVYANLLKKQTDLEPNLIDAFSKDIWSHFEEI